jgi:probable HAF family extracellular repeat protein
VTPAEPTEQGFLLDDGIFTTIDVPGATFTQAFGINELGQIVGSYVDVSGAECGFLLDKGSFATIDIPGATHTDANGINNRGQFVGGFTDAGGAFHGFLATPSSPCILRRSSRTS